MQPLPLQGIEVLELTHIVAGPSAGLIFAELGASVTKVESLDTGDTARNQGNQGMTFFSWNRNKESIAVDLRSEEGKEVFRRLVERSDVVMDNYSPGALARLGIDYDWGSKVNPRIIYCSIKGFLPGPYENRPYLDELAQMEGGMAYVTGLVDQPLRAGAPVVDIGAGVYGVVGILAAILRREQTGRGDHVRSGLFETTAFFMHQHMARTQLTGQTTQPRVSAFSSGVGNQMGWAVYHLFDTGDDQRIFIAIVADKQWVGLCKALGYDDLADDPDLSTNRRRCAHRDRFIDRIADSVSRQPYADMAELLHSHGVPYAPVNTAQDLIEEQHLVAGGYLVDVEAPGREPLKLPTLPIVMEETADRPTQPPPTHGEHTEKILAELGYSDEDIARLLADGRARQSDQMLSIDEQV